MNESWHTYEYMCVYVDVYMCVYVDICYHVCLC